MAGHVAWIDGAKTTYRTIPDLLGAVQTLVCSSGDRRTLHTNRHWQREIEFLGSIQVAVVDEFGSDLL